MQVEVVNAHLPVYHVKLTNERGEDVNARVIKEATTPSGKEVQLVHMYHLYMCSTCVVHVRYMCSMCVVHVRYMQCTHVVYFWILLHMYMYMHCISLCCPTLCIQMLCVKYI